MNANHQRIIASVGVALLAMGCGSAPPDQGTATSGAEGALPGKTIALQLFKDSNTSGPRLDVYDVDGNLAISVGGPIGTQVPESPPSATLADLYRGLHPAAAIPAELVPLDARLALARRSAASPEPVPPVPAIVNKSWSSFNAAVCQTFGVSQTTQWVPVECDWTQVTACNQTYLGHDAGWGYGKYFPVQNGERVYFWNNTPAGGFVSWYVNTNTGLQGVASFLLPAYWWTWTSVTGPTAYGNGPYGAHGGPNVDCAYSPTNGDVGITHHVYSQIVK